jgi:acetyl esterase/lipase
VPTTRDDRSVPATFLALSLFGAVLTLNAYRPRRRDSLFVVPSFFAGWITGELAPQVLVVQVAGAVALAWSGALEGSAGWLGLGLAVVSWAGLVGLARRAGRSRPVVEAALVEGLGARYHDALGELGDAADGRAVSIVRLALAIPLPSRRIDVTRDVRYAPGAGRRHRLDVYRPAGVDLFDAPVLLQVHGGAWIIGNKRQQALPLMHHLAAHGWVCVAPNYRLSPRATFPDHLVDVKLTIRWIREHIASFGGDPRFVAITGGSAGGHLASLAAFTGNDPAYQPGFEDVETSVSACVPFYGAYDLTNRFGGRGADGMAGLAERALLKQRLADDRDSFERASPLDRVRADAPPFMVVHGTDDSLVPVEEARAFAAALRARSRAPSVYLELPGAQHAFEIFHSVRSDAVVRGVHRFLTFVHDSRARDFRL